jgi:hypothetical protein
MTLVFCPRKSSRRGLYKVLSRVERVDSSTSRANFSTALLSKIFIMAEILSAMHYLCLLPGDQQWAVTFVTWSI